MNEEEEKSESGISTGKIIFYVVMFWILIVGLYCVVQIFNNSPINKAMNTVLGWGSATLGLATDNCKKLKECSKLTQPNCKNNSDECSWVSDKSKCVNYLGKEGSGGPVTAQCWFGLIETLSIIGGVLGGLAILKGIVSTGAGQDKDAAAVARLKGQSWGEYVSDMYNKLSSKLAEWRKGKSDKGEEPSEIELKSFSEQQLRAEQIKECNDIIEEAQEKAKEAETLRDKYAQDMKDAWREQFKEKNGGLEPTDEDTKEANDAIDRGEVPEVPEVI